MLCVYKEVDAPYHLRGCQGEEAMTIKNLSKWAAAALVMGSSAAGAGYLELSDRFGHWEFFPTPDGSWSLWFEIEADGGIDNGHSLPSLMYMCNEKSTDLVIDLGGFYDVSAPENANVETVVYGKNSSRKQLDWNWKVMETVSSTRLVIRDPDDEINQLFSEEGLRVSVYKASVHVGFAAVNLTGFNQDVPALRHDCEELRT